MNSVFLRKYLRSILAIGLIGFGLWGAFGVAAGEDDAPTLLFLPNLSTAVEGITPIPTRPTEPSQPIQPTPVASPGGGTPAGPPVELPLAAWTFQEGTGTTSNDSSGNGFAALLDSPTWVTQGNGNSAVRFDGLNDSVRVKNLNLSGKALTIVALIQAERLDHLTGDDARIISKAIGSAEQDHYWMLSTVRVGEQTLLRFRLKVNGVTKTLIANPQGVVVIGKWTHVAATFDGTTMLLYVDGARVGVLEHRGSVNDDAAVEAWIGDQPPVAGSRPWQGLIDDVQIFDRALTQEQIRSLIPASLVDVPNPPPGATPVPNPPPPGDGQDKTPPTISGVKVVVAESSAVVNWRTDELAAGNVVFGKTSAYELGPVAGGQSSLNHSVRLSGLSAGTTYHYQITSVDGAGNSGQSADATFTTAVPDTTPKVTFLETFDGAPDSPTPWNSSNWDITVHSRDRETLYQPEPMDAHHGAGCDAPPATHRISTYEETVFSCRDHMMTALNAGGYGVIYLTPNYQVDFTDGPATIRFDVSTLRSSQRDWIDLYVSPMEDHLQLALPEWLPDLSGEPKRAVKVDMSTFNGDTPFSVDVIRNHKSTRLDGLWWVGYEEYLEPSAKTRTTFELQISRTHIKFGMPDYDFWWVDEEIEPLDWTVGVVQLGHHSYNPTKDCTLPGGCRANTWHWDNVKISPARPFTMIHATQRYADASNVAAMTFEAPAPANAFLRFAGIGQNLEVSFDGGKTWEAARLQAQVRHTEEAFWSYFTPIPAGVTTVQFRGKDWWGGKWHVRDLSIWAAQAPAGN
jgi:hypothetical protein